jgi:hypothetical protein
MRYIKHRLNLLHFLTDKHLNVYIHFNFFIDSTTRSSSSDLKEIAVPNMRLFEQEKSTQDLRPHGDYCPMCPPSQRKHMNCDIQRYEGREASIVTCGDGGRCRTCEGGGGLRHGDESVLPETTTLDHRERLSSQDHST